MSTPTGYSRERAPEGFKKRTSECLKVPDGAVLSASFIGVSTSRSGCGRRTNFRCCNAQTASDPAELQTRQSTLRGIGSLDPGLLLAPEVQAEACRALAYLSLNPSTKAQIVANGGIENIVAALKAHVDDPLVQFEGCRALANLGMDASYELRIEEAGGV